MGSIPAQERGDVFRTGLEANPTVENTVSQNADWLRERAVPIFQSMLQTNPHLNVVYAHNDPMADAALVSAENLGIDLHGMLLIDIDGLRTAD